MNANVMTTRRVMVFLGALLALSRTVIISAGEPEPFTDWCDLEDLKSTYEKVKDNPEAAFVHLYLCTFERSCAEHGKTGANGWADGIVRSSFSYQRSLTGVQRGIDVTCPGSESSFRCFHQASAVHGVCELGPAFTNYCDEIAALDSAEYRDAIERWTDDQELFLEHAFEPCLDEVTEAGELSGDDGKELGETYENLARTARKTAQLYCDKKTSGWGFLGDALAIVESANEAVVCKK